MVDYLERGKYRIGQKVLVKVPESQDASGMVKRRESNYFYRQGVIAGNYPHHIMVSFGKTRTCFRKIDIVLGLEYYEEIFIKKQGVKE